MGVPGNKSNDRNRAAMERLRFIEACAWWKGLVNRQDLAGLFGVSMAQVSSALQRYSTRAKPKGFRRVKEGAVPQAPQVGRHGSGRGSAIAGG
jgi:hypothetical protein